MYVCLIVCFLLQSEAVFLKFGEFMFISGSKKIDGSTQILSPLFCSLCSDFTCLVDGMLLAHFPLFASVKASLKKL